MIDADTTALDSEALDETNGEIDPELQQSVANPDIHALAGLSAAPRVIDMEAMAVELGLDDVYNRTEHIAKLQSEYELKQKQTEAREKRLFEASMREVSCSNYVYKAYNRPN